MIEIEPHLFVGSELDYEHTVSRQPGWAIVHACKDPYHRRLLGYTGRGAPKDHPEYFMARRGDRLFLNLVDAADPDFFPTQVISAAVEFISQKVAAGASVLVHCNRGESRGPELGFLYLISHTYRISAGDPAAAIQEYAVIYPSFNPSRGMLGFIHRHFAAFREKRTASA